MSAKGDFEGVSTRQLARIIEESLPENIQSWADSIGLDSGTLARIRNVKYDWTALSRADEILTSLNRHISELTVIPRRTMRSAQRMAESELSYENDQKPTRAEIDARAKELLELHDYVMQMVGSDQGVCT